MRFQFAFCLSFLLFYCSYLNIQISLASGHYCLDDQKSLLLQLKNNLTFNPSSSSKLVLWNQSLEADCCNWKGVFCDNEGHVTGLDLSEEDISGELSNSSSLFSLIDLQNLNLACNQFNSVIPSGFQKLTKLSYLNLSDAGFVGQIPIEISHLTMLVVLDISTLSYSYEKTALRLENPNLAKLVENLTQVRELYLDGILISDRGNEWCNALSSSLPHLHVLSMSNCNLSGPIDSSLEKLKSLSVIRLDNNDLSAPVPEFIANFSNLTSLNLSYCGLNGTFPQDILKVQTLASLDISSNDGLNGYLPDFPHNSSLQRLILSDTNFSGASPDSISNLRKLSILKCHSCQFNGTIPYSISTLKKLTYLVLSNNYFRGPIPSFGMAKKLTHVDLSYNDLSGPISSAHFEGLQHIVYINLRGNSLNGSIPSSLFALPSLRVIWLSFNQFDGELNELSNLSNSALETIVLSRNNLEGPIPKSIFHLSNLKYLYLSSNKFNGTVHLDMIHSLKNLTALSLSYNNLSVDVNVTEPYPSSFSNIIYLWLDSCNLRTFPVFLRNLSMLDSLGLSNNQIQGRIPNWIWRLDSLQELNLSSNLLTDLEGPIPKSTFHLSSLRSLYLSYNKFNGTVHFDMIHSLKNLTELSLSHNNLSVDVNVTEAYPSSFSSIIYLWLDSCNLRTFPVFLRNLSMLNTLGLSNNQIQGRIPNWIWRLDSLRHLNLSSNLLTGFEAPLWNPNNSLIVLDLHSNKFHGQLPLFPPNLTYLDCSDNKFNSIITRDTVDTSLIGFLSLSNNDIHGSIPDSLCNASNLQVLDLSYNKFSGRIPQCLTESQLLVVLNVRDNMLNGSLPHTFDESCSLQTLDLHGNQLGGQLPKSLAHCTSLEVLDLGKNQILDFFPCWLWNISTLSVLVLQNNKFQGLIGCPKMKGSWLRLQIIDLSSNNFRGLLPHTLFTTSKAMMLDKDNVVFNLQADNGQGSYYYDSITVTMKGQELKLERILNIFTSIDFSSNNFEGPIPEELMNLKALLGLNLSHNSLSGRIPSSIGNLRQLESLDLSNNSLDGEIPTQLANLNFLSVLNLSFNNLEGRIPTGNQIQTFEATSFEGNQELCGPPLSKNCSNEMQIKSNSITESSFSWNFISSELGFIFGLGMIFLPLFLWKQWRLWYWKFVDDILYHIFPQMDFVHECHGGKNYRVLKWKRHRIPRARTPT